MNYTKIKLTSQQEELKKALFLRLLQLLPHRVLLIINYLLALQSKYGIAYPKQFTIGKKSKYSRATANKWCQRLQRMGFFHMKYTHLEANIYSLHGVFFDPEFRRQIEQYLPSARFMPLMMLTAISLTHIIKPNANKEIYRPLKGEYQNPLGELYWNLAHYGGEPPPTKQLSFTWEQLAPYEGLLCAYVRNEVEKEKRMNFTEKQLAAIAEYPSAAVAIAKKALTRELHAGKAISNPYNYFISICKQEAAKLASTGKMISAEHSKPLPSSVQYQHPNRAQEHHDWKMRMYKRQKKLHDRWIDWRNENYADMGRILNGYQEYTLLPRGVLPPEEPIYQGQLDLRTVEEWTKQYVTKPHELEMKFALPLLGKKQQPPLESQLPQEPMNSFDEQYTPLVDAMYEGYEECLD